ncbi:MAG: hypothetical protein KME23_02825 [Goleter apudmare HA4340-LM2]|jgi:hypothetical protein|nr:hypothetical protein [Goleter apudmare HA4340-LM2]
MFKNFVSNIQEDKLEADLSVQGFQGKKQQFSPVLRPQLACKVNFYQNKIIFSQNGQDFVFPTTAQSEKILKKLLTMMDGAKSLGELQQNIAPSNPEIINNFICHLDKYNLINDIAQVRLNSGIDTLLELEDLTSEILTPQLEQNILLKSIKSNASNLPSNVIYGFVIEHYHLFSHNCHFYSPILKFQNSTKIRQLINEFYCQEYGLEKHLLAALHHIGLSQEDLMETMPLPETMSICHGLVYWSSFDPLFFLSILGVIGGQTMKNFECYLQACERLKLDSDFLNPIRQLLNHLHNNQVENLNRRIFQEIPHIDQETKQRLRRQTYLFAEMYNNFYTAIFKYYSSSKDLCRQVAVF